MMKSKDLIINEKFIKFFHALEDVRVLDCIKRGFLMFLPLLMTGILANIVTSIPIPAVVAWYQDAVLGQIVYKLFFSIFNVTYGLMALYLCISIGYIYASNFASGKIMVMSAVMVANFICVLLSLGVQQEGFDMSNMPYGAKGVFTSFFTTIVCTKIFFLVYDFVEKRRHLERYSSTENRINSILMIMIPFGVCVLLFFVFNESVYRIFGVYSANEFFSDIMGRLFAGLGANLGSALLLLLFESLMYFVGIHGGSVMENVTNAMFAPLDLDSSSIISRTFLDTFGIIGGCGTSVCLFIAMIIWEKRKEQRTILKTALIPAIFNVNEPLLYGVPIIFNPFLFFPLIITPLVSISIAYVATYIGFIPVTTSSVAWTTPVFFNAYYATGTINGIIVQLIIILVGVFIYMPFVKLMNRANAQNIVMAADNLEMHYKHHMDEEGVISILKAHNSWSIAGEAIVSMLKEDILANRIKLYYQPQMDLQGKVYGAEALLRWKCLDRMMFPPFVIHMAEESGIQDELAMAITRRVCRDIIHMKEQDINVRISMNISGAQINNDRFIGEVIKEADKCNICDSLCIEVTEELDIDKLVNSSKNIARLNEAGIEVSMDDFSMGNTSIKSLQEHRFSHVKLDGSLVSSMEDNERSKEIIASIIQLGKSLNFRVVAEYVDSIDKLKKLKSLGCDYFQGYYYSPAVPLEEFETYAMQVEINNKNI